MNSKTNKKYKARKRRHKRVRKFVFGTIEKPRLVVFKSNKHIYGQIINDDEGKTLAAFSSLKLEVKENEKKTDVSFKVGEELAKVALNNNVESVVFDRAGFKYHGRVKALADGARKGGLKF